MVQINYQFNLDEDQEMEAQPNYLSSDESEIASPCSSHGPQLTSNFPDTYRAMRRPVAAQREQTSPSGNLDLQYPPNPPTSLMSDDDDAEVFTPISGNPAQHVSYTPIRCPHPLQLFQQLRSIPDTPEYPAPENREQLDLFRPYNLPENPSTSAYPLPSVSTVIEELQDMTLFAHIKTNAHFTGCLVCSKPKELVIEEAVADYLHQTAEPGETVRDRVLKRKAFLDELQSGVFTFGHRRVSQAAVCDGQVYSINYSNTQPGTQTNLLPMFEN